MKYMKEKEFACKCCGEHGSKREIMELTDRARGRAGIPFIVNSGYRCPKNNAAAGSTSSVHPRGYAVDIAVNNSRERSLVVDAFKAEGVTRVGIARSFVHADIDPEKSPDVIWLY